MDVLNYYGISGIIILILDVWALINILNSGQSMGNKLLWTVVVLILPVLGFIAWLIAGPRGPTSA